MVIILTLMNSDIVKVKLISTHGKQLIQEGKINNKPLPPSAPVPIALPKANHFQHFSCQKKTGLQ